MQNRRMCFTLQCLKDDGSLQYFVKLWCRELWLVTNARNVHASAQLSPGYWEWVFGTSGRKVSRIIRTSMQDCSKVPAWKHHLECLEAHSGSFSWSLCASSSSLVAQHLATKMTFRFKWLPWLMVRFHVMNCKSLYSLLALSLFLFMSISFWGCINVWVIKVKETKL